MTTKQKFKILSLLFTILSIVGLFLPNLEDTKKTYSTFDLTSYNGFKIIVLLIIALAIVAIAFNLISISYDKNKYFPIVTLAASFLCGLLVIFIKQLSAPSGSFSKSFWISDTKITYGTYIIIISSFLSFITNIFITIRSFVLGKNDDDYEVIIDEDDESEDIENEEISEELKDDLEIIDDFTKNE